jgi:UDP-glucose 4-epimerase
MKTYDVLVTGATGFIGQYLCEHLSRCGLSVIGIDKREADVDFELLCHDLTRPLPTKIQAISCVHLASSVGGILYNHSSKDDMVEYNDNINRTVVELCKQGGCNHMIFFSTINIFESDPSFAHEAIRTLPSVTPYAQSKARGELLFSNAFENFVAIRPTNVYGRRQGRTHGMVGESHVIPDLIDKINANDVVQVLGDGTQLRNFVHVSDIVEFVSKILLVDGSHYVNLRSNLTITIATLSAEIAKALGRKVELKFDPSFMKYETFQIKNFDLTPAINIGWHAKIHDISSGLKI